jgi:threonine synthase
MRVYAFSGIAAESSSCVPLAGLRRLLAEGRISGDAKIVLILTSAGIKWPDQLAGLASPAVSIDPSPHLLDALLFGEKAGGCFSCAR